MSCPNDDVIDVRLSVLASGEIQWEYVHGLFDQAVYGGRIDNSLDTDVLRSYLTQYFNSTMINGGKGLKVKLGLNITLPNSSDLKVGRFDA
jgi:dynein heavy chain 2, cytosolic